MNLRDPFDKVNLALEVGPPAWRLHPHAIVFLSQPGEPQSLQDTLDFVAADRDAQHARNLRQPEGDGIAWRQHVADVDHARMERSTGDFEEQLSAAAAGPVGDLRVEWTLEAEARGTEKRQCP